MTSENRRYIYGGTSLSLLIRVGGVGLLFVANILLARAMPQASYGTYAYIVELVAVAAVVATLGFDQIAIRVVPDKLAEGDRRGLQRFVSWGLGITLAMCLATGMALLFARRAGVMPPSIGNSMMLPIALLLASLSALRIAQECMRASKRIGLSQLTEQMVWPMALMLLAGALLLSSATPTVGVIVWVQIAVFLGGMFALFSILFRVRLTGTSPQEKANDDVRQWLGVSIPLSIAAALSIVLNRGDILALGSAVSAEQIAPYTAASRYAALLILGLAAASAAAAGIMRDCWREGDREGLQHVVDRTAGFSALFALPAALVFLIAPDYFLRLFGPGFVVGETAMRLLVIGQLINALTGPVALIVVVCDLARTFTVAMACSVAFFAILLWFLIPEYGIAGAATATLVSLAALNVGLGLLIWRKLGVRPFATPAAVIGAIRDLVHLLRGALVRTT